VNSEDFGSLAGDRYQLYIPVGFYKGNKAAIKQIFINNVNFNRSLMLELKKMKDLQNEHLVRFYGAVVEPIKEASILTEYCQKGSLQDILENDQIKLDWNFR
jgi:atrial natriuretic peptide receptor A